MCAIFARLQVLLELDCRWEAVRAADRAVQLAPHSAECMLTLARAQRTYGEVRGAKEGRRTSGSRL
jgi:hypothetical protein